MPKPDRYFQPYCYQPLTDPSRGLVYLPLNRTYKPLGWMCSEWVKYDDHVASALQFHRPADKIQWLAKAPMFTAIIDGVAFLYNDDKASWRDYDERLFQLHLYEVKKPAKSYFPWDDALVRWRQAVTVFQAVVMGDPDRFVRENDFPGTSGDLVSLAHAIPLEGRAGPAGLIVGGANLSQRRVVANYLIRMAELSTSDLAGFDGADR